MFIYLGYLFFNPESELFHWLTLVIVPFLLLRVIQRRATPKLSFRLSLASVGLARGNLKTGVIWATGLGIILGFLQIFLSRRGGEIEGLFSSGKVIYVLPLALMMILFTAGFTEEFFFRGILQTRLQWLINSKVLSVLICAALFGLYHLPYAYMNTNWPSHGDWWSAVSTSLAEGFPGGLILGIVYFRSRNNLLASVVVHTLMNTLPAMTMIKFGS